jgi:hypothetical protein
MIEKALLNILGTEWRYHLPFTPAAGCQILNLTTGYTMNCRKSWHEGYLKFISLFILF